MYYLTEEIKKRMLELKQIIQKKENVLLHAPEGIINIAAMGDKAQYYFKKDSSDKCRRYMRKSERPLIAAICQKEYDQKVLAAAQKELEQWERLTKNFPKQIYEEIYTKLSIHRQKWVQPDVLSDNEFIKQWEQVEYVAKGFSENAPEFYTDRGEQVRSKTEILIANALYKHKIPYRYECPLYLEGYGNIHPDFMALNVTTRTVFYWEHMGMMDDTEYVENAIRRIEAYEKNNIFPGENLILTYETVRHPISPRIIEQMIQRYLKNCTI